MKNLLLVLFILCSLSAYAQKETKYITKKEIKNDLIFLEEILENKSSYQGLNGYDYKEDFNEYLESLTDEKLVSMYDFGLFLTRVVGNIGDRHSYIKGYELRDSMYFPIAFAPFEDKVLVINHKGDNEEYDFLDVEFPYLKSINQIPIEQILPQILPGERLAPKKSYLTYAVRDLRDIETVFRHLKKEATNPISITLTNENGGKKELTIELVPRKERARLWDERFYRDIYIIDEDQYNDREFIDRFFRIEDNIAYIQIVDMVEKEDSPVFFQYLNEFMLKAKESDALIIDVRDNGGGTRDLIQELAGYFIRPDSIYVGNVAKQRGKLPLNDELKESLHARFLFAKDELNLEEQQTVDKFMASFKPMYNLDPKKYSEYYFYVLNGQKLSQDKCHYDKPIYILANERSFSAASVLVSVFKGMPNVKIVGVNTDGSSGNSENFELSNSNLRGKISTMVSFQKDGKVLDGIGTAPDILIERNLDQIFFNEDYQLNKLREIIQSQ